MSRSTLDQIVLALLAAAVFFFHLGSSHLWDVDEAIFSQAAAEMVQRGDYVVPYFNGELFPDKPALSYWLMASAYRVFGISELGARFWSALLSVGSVLLVYRLGRRLFHERVGILGRLDPGHEHQLRHHRPRGDARRGLDLLHHAGDLSLRSHGARGRSPGARAGTADDRADLEEFRPGLCRNGCRRAGQGPGWRGAADGRDGAFPVGHAWCQCVSTLPAVSRRARRLGRGPPAGSTAWCGPLRPATCCERCWPASAAGGADGAGGGRPVVRLGWAADRLAMAGAVFRRAQLWPLFQRDGQSSWADFSITSPSCWSCSFPGRS